MSDDEEQSDRVSVRMTPLSKRQGEIAANARGQNISQMIRDLVNDEVARVGITPEVVERVDEQGMSIPEALSADDETPAEATSEN